MTEYVTIENGNSDFKMVMPKDHTNCYLYNGGHTCDGGQMYGFEIRQPQPLPTTFETMIVAFGWLFLILLVIFFIATIIVAWAGFTENLDLRKKVTGLEDEVRDLEHDLDEED